jgi:hypothetical protein
MFGVVLIIAIGLLPAQRSQPVLAGTYLAAGKSQLVGPDVAGLPPAARAHLVRGTSASLEAGLP